MAAVMNCLCPGPKAAVERVGIAGVAVAGTGTVKVIKESRLFVSEPDPRWFGNEDNVPTGSAAGRAWTNKNWLKSRFHFNFAEYHGGPSSFGVLRVMNDDLVQPRRGFGTHPHRDMEIMTFIINGQLTHKDSMGIDETLGRGSVQFMTAGTGIRHSEHNLQDEPLRFVQCWVVPRRRGFAPNYGSMAGGPQAEAARRDQWAHVVSDAESPTKAAVQIQQDCNVFMTELSPSKAAPSLFLDAGRQGYMLCVEGSATLTDGSGKVHNIEQHDGIELKGPLSCEPLAGAKGAMLLMFEMQETSDSRRDF
mmetsp:Transcript_41421/g.77086  ORF Transcript_41421/g.77086 Transcript_41421/m.77086 type:complete len:306 (-) Transcript_41421:91-1008(-)